MNENPTRLPSELGPLLLVLLSCVAAFLAYRTGLPGNFIFDDYPNLKALGAHGGIKDLASLKLYLDDAFAGPTGRPVSMLSFLLDARDWPADPGALKFKNILIHLLIGIALFWCAYQALLQMGRDRPAGAAWIAAGAAAIWLLHPYHVSTVLYVIQRMAQLSTLFVLIGFIGYLYGRKWLARSPRRAYATMSLSVVFGTGLAALSKENGALLPLLVLVAEWTLFASAGHARPARWWKAVFLGLPSLAIVAYLARSGVMGQWSGTGTHPFTVVERLMTEARILFEYLGHLLFPRAQTPGMFRDDIVISTSLLDPATTLPAVLGIIALVAGGLALRRRLPLLSFAVLFFLAGHLVESTTIRLELFFEHRNYLPSTLLFLPIAQGVVRLAGSVPRPATVAGVVALIALTVLLGARAQLWSDRARLYLTWAEENPASPRAQLSAANILEKAGAHTQAVRHMGQAVERLPGSLALRLHQVRLAAREGETLQRDAVDELLHLASTARFSNEALVGARMLSGSVMGGQGAPPLPASAMLKVWQALQENERFTTTERIRTQIMHQRGRLLASMGRPDAAMVLFEQTLRSRGEVEAGLMQMAILAAHGYFCRAREHLREAEGYMDTDPRAVNNAEYYRKEIDRLYGVLEEDIRANGLECR